MTTLLPVSRVMRQLLTAVTLTILLLIAVACERTDVTRADALPPDAVVLVIGDSLVSGTGARPDQAWPQRLAEATGWSVINAGIPGDTSAEARRRLPELLDMHAPHAVIIAVGGNDFLRNVPPGDTRANIEAMIRRARDATEHVALVAIPEKSVGAVLLGDLADHSLFAELAVEHEITLIPDTVSEVLSDEALRADRIHANAAGYAHVAAGVRDALRTHGWLP